MSTIFSDSFSYANGALPSPYTVRGPGGTAFSIDTGTVVTDFAAAGDVAYDSVHAPGTADYSVSLDLTVFSSDAGGVCGRRANFSTNDNDMYFLTLTTTTLELFRRVSGANTSLGTFTVAFANLEVHTLKLSMQGTTISGSLDGVQRISVTDANISAAGNWGIVSYLVASADNLLVEDFASAGPPRLLDLMHRPMWQTLMSM